MPHLHWYQHSRSGVDQRPLSRSRFPSGDFILQQMLVMHLPHSSLLHGLRPCLHSPPQTRTGSCAGSDSASGTAAQLPGNKHLAAVIAGCALLRCGQHPNHPLTVQASDFGMTFQQMWAWNAQRQMCFLKYPQRSYVIDMYARAALEVIQASHARRDNEHKGSW